MNDERCKTRLHRHLTHLCVIYRLLSKRFVAPLCQLYSKLNFFALQDLRTLRDNDRCVLVERHNRVYLVMVKLKCIIIYSVISRAVTIYEEMCMY